MRIADNPELHPDPQYLTPYEKKYVSVRALLYLLMNLGLNTMDYIDYLHIDDFINIMAMPPDER